MISNFEKNVISMIRSAMTKQEPVLVGDVNYEEIYDYAKGAQVIPLIYYGMQNVPGFFDSEAGKKFFMSTMRYGEISRVQMSELDKICDALDENNIDYMRLKGAVIKGKYEYPEMRSMSDADVLIRTEQYEKIKEICENMGYPFVAESDHELIHVEEKKKLMVEFHKYLIPSYNEDFFEFFGIGWDFAKKVEGRNSEYEMSDEDFFIFIFAHFAKHYRDSGVGIKYITDFYLCLKQNPDMNMEYIKEAFVKLKIDKFWENVEKLLRVWFEGEESNEIVDHMTTKMFGNYTYGVLHHGFMSNALKRSNKGESHFKIAFSRLWYVTFLPYKNMKFLYPSLGKVPFLLPFYWVYRWIHALFRGRKNIKHNIDNLKSVNKKDIEAHHNELTYVGLDYNF